MAHGHKDWGEGAPASTIYSIQDIGELAARLGSIVTFDRRGNVMWLDDFESGIEKWEVSNYGAGYAVTWSAEKARNGAFSCKLATGAGDQYNVAIKRGLPYPVLSSIGFEASVLLDQYWEYFQWPMDIETGSQIYTPVIKYDDTDNKFYYKDENGDYQETGIVADLACSEPVFHTVKLVVDAANAEYKRLIVDNQSVDLSGRNMKVASSSEPPYLYIALRVVTSSALASAIAYVDDVIVTQNEP